MPVIIWDELAEREFHRGVDHGVLYDQNDAGLYVDGVPWNGLTAVNRSPSGSEANKQWADNMEYVSIDSRAMFGATIEALMFPTEFLKHDGVIKTANGLRIAMQARDPFGFCWRTLKGNALDEYAGEVLHMAYGCKAQPGEIGSTTMNDGVELATFSYTLTTTPIVVVGYMPTSYISIDSTDPDVDPAGFQDLKDVLYGTVATPPRLPLPLEIDTLLAG